MDIKSLKKISPYLISLALLLALISSLAWAFSENRRANDLGALGATNGSKSQADVQAQLEDHGITPLTPAQASNNIATADELTYLIEEEKLAHDVYQAMYDRWGSRVFGNIKTSETSHQDMLLAIMTSRGLADPRKSNIGEFTNPDLQHLYDSLIAQGNQNQTEAYRASVTIEETDIADINRMLANLDAKDTDIRGVLENLLNGSENHLRAFTRQASR